MLKSIKPNDKTAPRFRWTKGRCLPLTQDLYKQYSKEVENPIEDFSLFRDVVEDFSEELKKAAISNRDGVKLPAMMGILAVCSYKPAQNQQHPINWAASTEAGLKLKEYNLHTAGLACKIVYSAYTAKYKFRNWRLWKFEGNRDFKAQVSSNFEKNYKFYKRLDNKSHVSKMFRDEYVSKRSKRNDSIRTDIQHQGDEQVDQRGLQDNG